MAAVATSDARRLAEAGQAVHGVRPRIRPTPRRQLRLRQEPGRHALDDQLRIGLGEESGFDLARLVARGGQGGGAEVILISARAETD